MSSGEDYGHHLDDLNNGEESFSAMPSHDSYQQRQMQSTQPNIYTPLSLSSHTVSEQISSGSGGAVAKKDVLSTATHVVKSMNSKSKANLSARSRPGKSQRSSVRPFFCCGSELSLVSLVDGIELKEESNNSKKLQSIECSSSSDDESQEFSPFRLRSNTLGSVEMSRPSTIRRKKKEKHVVKKKFWSLRLQSKWSPRWKSRRAQHSKCQRDFSQQSITSGFSPACTATGASGFSRQSPAVLSVSTATSPSPFLDLFHFFPVERIFETGLPRRAEDMTVGIEIDTHALSRTFRSNVDVSGSVMDILRIRSRLSSANSDILRSSDSPIEDLLMNNLMSQAQNSRGSVDSWGAVTIPPQIHTQIDYVHYLVPDLAKITGCSYYWGVMDRYEAEHLLENKPPGTFLLRDSAQEDFLFSVSFRRYNRSLHARIEQWNHRFSFDAHDPNVFSASTVCELMEHYKDPSLCMFFEPMLTRPLHRTFPFSLQHMSRTVICDKISYDDIQALPIPNSFKKFLQTYHYKQKVRVRRFDAPEMASAESRVVT